MFNIFKSKKQVDNTLTVSEPVKQKYSTEIEQIHHEFDIASDVLLAEAGKIIEEANKKPVEKVKRLMSLGFTQAKEVDETKVSIQKSELSAEQIKLVQEYKIKYPLHKFITEEQVKTICYKYGLVCGDVSKYKGFVPEKNMKQIEQFKIKEEDKIELEVVTYWGKNHIGYASYSDLVGSYKKSEIISNPDECFFVEFSSGQINLKGGNLKWEKSAQFRYAGDIQLKICAPIKDMDMTGMTIEDGYKMKKIHIPDPVVLQAVKGGFIILTAWGDEASDPIVVNEINN